MSDDHCHGHFNWFVKFVLYTLLCNSCMIGASSLLLSLPTLFIMLGVFFSSCISFWIGNRMGSHVGSTMKLVESGSRFACCPMDLVCWCRGFCNRWFPNAFRGQDPSKRFCCSIGFGDMTSKRHILHSFAMFHPFWWMLALSLCRIGEAKVPGPDHTWSLAVCNPAGLNHKSHLFDCDLADIWLISETHLTSAGCRSFRKGLHAESEKPRWFVPGFPVRPRSTVSEHGTWSGVGVLSQFPCQMLPHDWLPWAFESSRLVAVTTFCHDLWLSGVVAYGMPTGPTHPQAKMRTNLLLQEAVRRVLCMDGPRFLGGDFNHDADELQALEILKSHHFVEVQDLLFAQQGIAPKPTCKHKTQRDFLYISPELVPLFVGVTVDHTHWIDHASVIASFAGTRSDVVKFPWPLPIPFPWDRCTEFEPGPVVDYQVSLGCDVAYSQIWQDIEKQQRHIAKLNNVPVSARHFGRGQRKDPIKVVGNSKPLAMGRRGEPQPLYFGMSFLHKHWFRQLRRLQSFIRVAKVSSKLTTHLEHQASLWHAIRSAPGFKPTFEEWWTHRDLKDMEEPAVPFEPPSAEIATLLFTGLEQEIRALEKHLRRSNKGHSLDPEKHSINALYRSVKRDAPAQVDVLVSFQHAHIENIDEQDVAIELDRQVSWSPEFPLKVSGVELEPIVVTEDKIYLPHLQGIQVGDTVIQNRSCGKLELVFQAFIDHWSKFWIKHSQVPPSQWEAVLQFARQHLGTVNAAPLDLSLSLLRATAKSKKAQAATGLDGVSRKDILSLSSNQLRAIQAVYHHAQQTGSWPQQTVEGLVKSLAKVPSPTSVGEFRPITVFSIVYRLWSSAQSRYWLACMEQCLDRLLCGNRSGYQAATLWRRVLEAVEWAQQTQESTCGLIIDLSKAYNTLPRLPCLTLALIAGVDLQAITAWAGALGQMTRGFWVQGSVSPPTPSDRGFPEGCGLSCLAMLLLNQVWHSWVKTATSMALPMSYVDNWEVICHDAEGIRRSLDATLDFAQSLDLVVDQNKTCTWATDASSRADLRQGGFRVIHSGRDLGAHVVYSRQLRNATQVSRFSDLDDFWPRLRKAQGSFSNKARIIRTAAWPRALHGISATVIGRKHFVKLRSKVMQALNQDRPGANPMLLCHLVGTLDPQFQAIIDTFRQWRAVGNQAHQFAILQQLNEPQAETAIGSLTAVLIQRLHVLGWSILPNGYVIRQPGWNPCDLSCCNWQELVVSAESAWHSVVSCAVLHRSGFQEFSSVDFTHSRQAVASEEPFAQGILRKLMIGAEVTNQHACYWSDNGTTQCSQCGELDSLEHRFWSCQSTRDLREQLDPQIPQVVPVLPPVLTHHGWTLKSPLDAWWWKYLQDIPETVECPEFTPSEFGIDVFTDGSCLWPTCASYRVASWAVCLAGPISQNSSPEDTIVLGAGHLKGAIQTAFRAELMAVLMTLRWAVRWTGPLRIWLDCQGVLDKFLLYTAGKRSIHPTAKNSDLWVEAVDLAFQIGLSRIQLIKVEAHATVTDLTPEALRWVCFNNDCVDKAAKQCNIDRGAVFWRQWERHALFVHNQHWLADAIRAHQVRVMTRWTVDFSASQPVVETIPRLGKSHPIIWNDVRQERAVPRALTKSLGHEFAQILVDWWNDIIDWTPQGKIRWLAFSQLYIHFQLSTHHPGLIKCNRGWSNPSVDVLLIPEDYPFRTRSKWFRLYLQATWKAFSFNIGTALTRPTSTTLVSHVGCASVPVKQVALDLIEEWLRKHSPPIRGHGQQLDCLPVAW